MKPHPSLSDGQLRLLADVVAQPASAQRDAMRDRVAAGEFDDFISDAHAAPGLALIAELVTLGWRDLERKAMAGEYDAGHEAAEAWAASPAGRAAIATLGGNGASAMRGGRQ